MTGIERLADIANDGPYSGGMIHISVQKLREICEQIEREVDDISGRGSDILAWVEEHGGLDAVKKRLMPEGGDDYCCHPSDLTHRAPVLAADGEPLEVGQTVYHIADGKEYTVEKLFKDGAMVTPDGITGGRCRAEYLTHERPDSWERLEEHKDLSPFDYCKKVGHKLDTFEDAERFKSRDLVRRAKALAGDA